MFFASGWNIGPAPGNELPVREVVEIVLNEWGEGTWKDVSQEHQIHEAGILRLAIDKAMWELGWRPRWSVHETLRRTVQWYQDYYRGDVPMREISLEQIEAYELSPGDDIPTGQALGTAAES